MALDLSFDLSAAVLECAADEVLIVDSSGKVVFVNDATCRQLGYTQAELLNLHVWDLDRAVTPDNWSPNWDELVARKSNNFDTLHIRKDGSIFPCRIKTHLFLLKDQPHLLAFAEDLSGVQSLEVELFQQKERLELVLKGTGLGLWDWNPQTGDVVFDERWCRMLGYTLDEIPANVESWSSRVHPDDIDACFADIQAHIAGDTEFYQNTHRMKHRDGRWIYILDRGQVMARDKAGNPVRFTGSHEDVTQRMEAEQKRNELYGMVAHELRTPVAAISMMTEDPDISDFKKFSRDIHRAARDLMFTLDDMRLLINPDLKRPVRYETYTFEDVSTAVGYSVAGVISRAGFGFHNINAVPDTLIAKPLETDLYRVKVALTNLIKNACLHSEGNEVWLISGVVTDEAGQTQIIWTVGDNGKGIPQESIETLFEPYIRGDTKAEGTGMGLHIARLWIREIGGDLFYKRRSQGSEFILTIPLIEAQKGGASDDSGGLYAREFLSGLTVLVVEDDPILRSVTQKLLEKVGAKVDVAENGRLGLNQMNERYDLVCTDYFMPELTGLELIKRARAQGFKQPILGVTAATIGQEQATLKAAGADLVLQKPMTRASLSDAIEALVNMGRLQLKEN